MLFGFWDAVLEIFKQSPEGEDERVEDVVGLLHTQIHAFGQILNIDLDDLLLDASHDLDGDVVEHIDVAVLDCLVDFVGVVQVKFVEDGGHFLQEERILVAHSSRHHLVDPQEKQDLLLHFFFEQDREVGAFGGVYDISELEQLHAQSFIHQFQLDFRVLFCPDQVPH